MTGTTGVLVRCVFLELLSSATKVIAYSSKDMDTSIVTG